LSLDALAGSRCRANWKIPEIFKNFKSGWNRTSKTLQGILVKRTKTVSTLQDRNSQPLKIGELVKQSSRKGRKLIVVKIAKTVRRDQDISSQPLKTSEPVENSSRKRRKLIVAKIT
jgi:hypothetical protein